MRKVTRFKLCAVLSLLLLNYSRMILTQDLGLISKSKMNYPNNANDNGQSTREMVKVDGENLIVAEGISCWEQNDLWEELQVCPNSTIVTGHRLRYLFRTGLTGVELKCTQKYEENQSEQILAIDFENKVEKGLPRGQWENWKNGSGSSFAAGFSFNRGELSLLRSVKNYNIIYHNGDQTDVNSDLDRVVTKCPPDHAICGLTAMMDKAGLGILTAIGLKCCLHCVPMETWVTIHHYNNTGFLKVVQKVNATVGLQRSLEKSTDFDEIPQSVVNKGFHTNIGKSSSTGFDWSHAPYSVWNEKRTVNKTYSCEAKRSCGLKQLVGQCGSVRVPVEKFCEVSVPVGSPIPDSCNSRPDGIPYQLSIRYYENPSDGEWEHICGGVILGKTVAITAANCFDLTRDVRRYRVVAEEILLDPPSDDNKQVLAVQEILIHPDYTKATNGNDIAILHVDKFRFNKYARGVWLSPFPNKKLRDKTAVISGWNNVSRISGFSNSLQKGNVTFLSQEDCLGRLKTRTGVQVREGVLCALDPLNRTCSGDSGGPLVIQNYKFGNSTGNLLVGITSFGAVNCSMDNKVGVFTEISRFYDWIQENRFTSFAQAFRSADSRSPITTERLTNQKILNDPTKEKKDAFEETLNLLEEGAKEIELREDYRDLVLVAGLIGAGKTTITKFITRPKDLEAYNSSKGILIRDIVNNSISVQSSVIPKTIFPQLLIHGPSNTAFYDLSGFSDSRNATIEIANAVLMKKVAEHAKSLKILLIMSHKALRRHASQSEFKRLIEHVIKFFKHIKKFTQGVVLIASKVESERSNELVIYWIGEFLEGVAKDLPQMFQDREKLRHAKNFVSALLEKDEETGKYKRIGMFRQPQVEGLLIDDPDFKSNQQQVEDLVLKEAQFVETSPGDFGFSVSADSTRFAETLVTKTKNKVALVIERLAEVIEEELFEFPGNSSSSDSVTWPLLKRWTREHNIFHQMATVLNEVGNCTHFFHELNDTLSVFSNPGAKPLILDLFKLNTQLGFFDGITAEYNITSQQWTKSFFKLETRVGFKTRNLAAELSSRVMTITSAISTSFKEQTLTLVSKTTNALLSPQLDKKELFNNLTEDFNSINQMQAQLLRTCTFAQFSNITLDILQKTHLQVEPSVLTSLKDITLDMNFNSGVNGRRFPFNIDVWIKPIELCAMFLQSQIQALSSHLPEEEMRENGAKMSQQISTLREETRLAAEKAEEEFQQLALEYQERDDLLSGSKTSYWYHSQIRRCLKKRREGGKES